MRFLRRSTIGGKLTFIVLAVSSFALLATSVAFGLYDRYTFRRAAVADLTTLADIIGSNSTAALVFQDPGAARDILRSLDAKKSVTAACIYTRGGKVLATYQRDDPDQPIVPPSIQADGAVFRAGRLTLFYSIVVDKEKIGTVFLESDLTALNERMRRHAVLLGIMSVLFFVLVFFLSSRLQRAVADPIRELAWTMRIVGVQKNYELRVVSRSEDEVGLLIEGFNGMLEQIQSRDAALQKAREELEQRVEERTRELQEEIAERKRADAQLEERTAYLNSLIHNSPLAIVAVDADHRIQMCNPTFERIFSYGVSEVLDRDLDLLVSPDGTGVEASRVTRRVLAGEVVHASTRRRRKDGTLVDVELHAAPLIVHGRLIGSYVLYQDITERKRFEAELQRAKEAAEAANRAKSVFLASMSHEIRTPMNGILGMTELALETDLTPEQREYLSMVRASAESLLRIINDILDFSKIEAGKLDLDSVELKLRRTLGETLKTLSLQAHEKSLELALEVRPEVPDRLLGDPARLRQLLVNLVGNAIKFTEQGEVVVRVEAVSRSADRAQLRFVVADTGIGIPPEKLDMIFEAFSQGESSSARRHGGTGLGLSISKRLVEVMGGGLRVESKPGEGTTFHFTVPFDLPQVPVQEALSPAVETLENLPVLVVDDNATNRRILEDMLASWRMAPTVVDGGRAALTELEHAHGAGKPFPLILLDLHMPGMDGLAVAEQIRRKPELAGDAIMMLTSDRQRADAARCRELGIAARLTKPITQSELLDTILKVLGHQVEEAELESVAAPRGPQRALRILLAEDNAVNRALAVRLLGRVGHSVEVACNGREALEILDNAGYRGFDVVLMDVQMPEMDGVEATAAIRAREKANGVHLPIIAMTAHAMKGDRERCLEAGMDGYLPKPIRSAELFEEIERHVGRDSDRPSRSQEILDNAALRERVAGDAGLLAEMVELFLREVPQRMDALRSALAEGNDRALERAAHAVRGMVSSFAAAPAAAAALRLEKMGRAGDLAHAGDALASLESEIEQLEPLLDELRKGAVQ